MSQCSIVNNLSFHSLSELLIIGGCWKMSGLLFFHATHSHSQKCCFWCTFSARKARYISSSLQGPSGAPSKSGVAYIFVG
jgi:hypothetical protein